MPITDPSSGAARDFARALIDTSQLPLLLLDGEGRVVSASGTFYGSFDIPGDEADGRLLGEIGGGGWGITQLKTMVANALGNGEPMGDYETDLIRKGKRPRRLVVNVHTVIHGAAADTRVLMAITDVTHVRQAEKLNSTLLLEKDSLLRERAILLDELQHRIANSLQIIASVLLLKARAVTSEETRLHLHDAHNRVMSLAAVQKHLQSTVGEIDVGPYLTKLCESLAASMIREARDLTLVVEADDAVIGSHEAVSLGLVVTELVINALKHAFPAGRDGHIKVSYKVDDKGWTLSINDDGVGMATKASDAKPGLGTSIVEGLARQLGAKVTTANAKPGLIVALHAPAHAVVAPVVAL